MEPVSAIDTKDATDSSLSIVRFIRKPDQGIMAIALSVRKTRLEE